MAAAAAAASVGEEEEEEDEDDVTEMTEKGSKANPIPTQEMMIFKLISFASKTGSCQRPLAWRTAPCSTGSSCGSSTATPPSSPTSSRSGFLAGRRHLVTTSSHSYPPLSTRPSLTRLL